MASIDELSMAVIMANIARVAQWTVTGEIGLMPPELQEWACKVAGVDYREWVAAQEQRMATEPVEAEIVEEVPAIHG